MEVEERLLNFSDMNRCGEKQEKVTKILLRSIDKRISTANKAYHYFENLKYQDDIFNSYHYIICEKGKVLRLIPEDEISFPIGHPKFDEKKISIGLSITNSTKELEKSLITLINQICKKYNLNPLEDVITEYDILNTRNLSIYIDNKYILNSILKQCTG